MPVDVSWFDIGVRLLLTVVAGALIGINRLERGRPAGLRTTILVCLAASVSMIQANVLMPTIGKTPDSFVVIDLMRLPLGVLTGMGFIGAGAILRRGDIVQGVTTAATLWLVTILGLCFGGGQLGLGLATLGLALAVLWGLKRLEHSLRQDRHAVLIVRSSADSLTEAALRMTVLAAGYRIGSWDVAYDRRGQDVQRKIRCEARWHGRPDETDTPRFVEQLRHEPGVVAVRWSA